VRALATCNTELPGNGDKENPSCSLEQAWTRYNTYLSFDYTSAFTPGARQFEFDRNTLHATNVERYSPMSNHCRLATSLRCDLLYGLFKS